MSASSGSKKESPTETGRTNAPNYVTCRAVCHLAQDVEVAVVAGGLLDSVQEYEAQGHGPVAHRPLRAAIEVQARDESAVALGLGAS